MSTVQGKTSIKIDELINGSIISGTVDSSGHLILTNRGGAEIDAGFVSKPFGGSWSPTIPYENGDVVGYAGILWKALATNTDKPPALYTSFWTRLTGESSNDWSEKDPYFSGDSLSESWDFATKTGAPTVEATSISGEFETGTQALKISCPISATQTFFQKEENIVRGGETITVNVRARLLSAAAGARINANLLQNLAARPEPGATGNTSVASTEGAQALTTSWATYTFTLTCVGAKPRAMLDLVVSADGAGSAVFLIDRVQIVRGTNPALQAWPVGSIFMSISPTNPNVLLGGGTWAAWGSGRMPVSVDPGQTEFDTVEETGGAKTVTLTDANLPPHQHSITHDHGDGTTNVRWTETTTTTGTGMRVTDVDTLTGGGGSSGTATIAIPTYSGVSGDGSAQGLSSSPVNNLPPYITCYMWKRTA